MSTEVILQLVLGLGVLPGLFVYLLFDTRKNDKEREDKSIIREDKLQERLQKQLNSSAERESKLLNHLQKSDSTNAEISKSIRTISDNFISMQKDIEYLKTKIE